MTAALALPEVHEVKVIEATKDFIIDTTYRCDGCGAQAYVMVELLSGGELYLCMHHARRHEAALKPISKTWYSEEANLIEDRKTGSEN